MRSRVLEFLATGDTLEAMDLLEESPRGPTDEVWADSMLDRLVLPGPTVATPARRGYWIARGDFGTTPADRTHRLWTVSTRLDRVQGLDLGSAPGTVRAGIRLHGIAGDFVNVGAIEPLVEWTVRSGNSDALLKGWGLWANEVDNDLGAELQMRFRPFSPRAWIGPRITGSVEGENSLDLVTGLEFETGSWSLSGSVRTGWVRVPAPDRCEATLLEVDSIPLTANQTVSWTTSGGSDPFLPGSAEIQARGVPLERIDRNRWNLESLFRAQWRSGGFQVGPGLELESRIATSQERWMPDLRSVWPSGSTFLTVTGRPGSTVAVLVNQPIQTPQTVVDRYASVHASPHLSGSWRSDDRAWGHEAVVVWNQPLTASKGHPLADDRHGVEARWASSFRW